jgi:MOSC domain-containing protein YiiM
MKILSVNTSPPRDVRFNGHTVHTSICKEPRIGPVHLGPRSLDGDGQADRKHHGHPHQAVYFYDISHHRYWSETLGRSDLVPGQFGENFTCDGFLETEVRVGDVYRIGGAVVRATSLRGPCGTLARRMGVADFVALFRASLRLGVYAATLEEGPVEAGDEIVLLERDPRDLTIHRLGAVYYGAPVSRAELEEILAHPHLPAMTADALRAKHPEWSN